MMQDINQQLETEGFACVPEFVSPDRLEQLKKDLQVAYDECRRVQQRNGIEMAGAGHHLIGLGPIPSMGGLIKFLEQYETINAELEQYFGGKYIINTFGGNILLGGMSYANYIHRDQRSHSGSLNLMLNTILMLDDFTAENGATWLMRGGHKLKDQPTEAEFMPHAFQLIGKAGTLAMFSSNVWHRAGDNMTGIARRALTVIFSRPFIKPQFAYDRIMGEFSPYVQQLLGYFARIPETHEQFYQKSHYYRKDQG